MMLVRTCEALLGHPASGMLITARFAADDPYGWKNEPCA